MKTRTGIFIALAAAASLVLMLWLLPAKAGGEAPDVQALEDQARAHLGAQEWDAAAAAYQNLTALNPYNGDYFLYQGYALLQADRCAEAMPAFDKALFLSANTGSAAFHASRCALRLGQMDRFKALLKTAVANSIRNFSRLEAEPNFETAIQDQSVRHVMMMPADGELGRDQQWAWDIDTYVALLEAIHPDPFHSADRAHWFEEVAALKASIPDLTDLEITGGLMRLSAEIGDGHSSVFPPETFHLLPVHPYRFKDGFFVKAAAPQFAHLIGKKVVSVNGVAIEDIAGKAHAFLASDNPMTKVWFEEALLQTEEGYALAGVDGPLTFQLESGESVEIPADSAPRNPLGRSDPEGWTSLPEGIEPPLWMKNLDRDFWFETIPGTGILYVQINQVADGNSGKFADLSAQLLDKIATDEPLAVIIDLRMNNGGNAKLTNGLVTGLAQSPINQKGKLFVVTGRRTFSAAGLLSAYLERYTEALFAGEPMSAKPNVYGDDNIFTLPYSGVTGSISSTFNSGTGFAGDDRPWIAPDIPAELTAADYFTGRDPVLDAILAYLEKSER